MRPLTTRSLLLAAASAMVVVSQPAPVSASVPLAAAWGGFGRAKTAEAAADTCAPLRAPFDRARNYVRDKTMQGVAVGVAGGLLATFLAGGHGGGDYLKGAAAGAMFGGLTAYIAAKRQQTQDVAQLQSLVSNDFDPEMQVYSGLASSLARLGDCRRAQVYSIRTEFEAGTITKDVARTRLATVQQAVAADDALVAAAAQVQTQRVGYFARAYGSLSGYSDGQLADDAQAASLVAGNETGRYMAPIQVVRVSAPLRPDLPGVEAPAPEPITQYAIPAQGVRLLIEPAIGGSLVALIPQGATVSVTGPAYDPAWSEVEWNGRHGYVFGATLGDDPPVIARAAAKGRKGRAKAKAVAPPPAPPPVARVRPVRVEPKGPQVLKVNTSKLPPAATPQQKVAAAAAAARTTQMARSQNTNLTVDAITRATQAIG